MLFAVAVYRLLPSKLTSHQYRK